MLGGTSSSWFLALPEPRGGKNIVLTCHAAQGQGGHREILMPEVKKGSSGTWWSWTEPELRANLAESMALEHPSALPSSIHVSRSLLPSVLPSLPSPNL